MNLECPHCQVQVRIDPARLPQGRAARVACPKCRDVFPLPTMGTSTSPSAPLGAIGASSQPVPTGNGSPAGFSSSPLSPEAEGWLRRELDGLRDRLKAELASELLGAVAAGGVRVGAGVAAASATGADGSTAIVASPDASVASAVGRAVMGLGFQPRPVSDLKTAIKALDDEELRLVVIDQALGADDSDSTKLIEWINRMPGTKRRRIFVAWMSPDVRTMDGGFAFIRGANVVVSTNDLPRLGEVLTEGLAEHEKLYRVFHEVMETVNG